MSRRESAFTLIELLVVVSIISLLVSILLPSLSKAREQAKKAYCCNNLAQFGRAVYVYAGEYKYFPPHNPYPAWVDANPSGAGVDSQGFDPNIGWLMTYAMRMIPPETYANDPDPKVRSSHFKWYVLGEDELPEIVTCPSANRDLLFTMNPEIDPYNVESFMFQYAAFYQTSGTARCGTIVKKRSRGVASEGGTNPVIPDPSSDYGSQPCDNVRSPRPGAPSVWLFSHVGDPTDASGMGVERRCWIQATDPCQIDSPGRVYYLADSREYRPAPTVWPPAGINDGWPCGWDSLVFMSARHDGVPNAVYLDGHAGSDGFGHPVQEWNMEYDPVTKKGRSNKWRCSTWSDSFPLAGIRTQHHIMPVLNIVGWDQILQGR